VETICGAGSRSPHLAKFYDLIQVRHADGQNRPGFRYDPAVLLLMTAGILCNMQRSGAPQYRALEGKKHEDCRRSQAESSIPWHCDTNLGLNLLQSDAIIPVQKQIGIDEPTTCRSGLFQCRPLSGGRIDASRPLFGRRTLRQKKFDLMLRMSHSAIGRSGPEPDVLLPFSRRRNCDGCCKYIT